MMDISESSKVKELKSEIETLKTENRDLQRQFKELNDNYLLEVVKSESMYR